MITDLDAEEIIEYTGSKIKVSSNLLENYTTSLLNEAALTGSDRILKRFYDILLNMQYVKLPLNFLDPLIITHIEQYVFSILFKILFIKYN